MEGPPGTVMPVTEDWRVVLLSLLVAAAASYTALDLTGPAANARSPRIALLWTFASTIALAIGVWSMHFVGMQAFGIGIPIAYDVPVVVLSFAIALAGSLIALFLVVRIGPAPATVAGAAVVLGLCLAAMHYTGMAALRIAATVRYDPVWVAISVLIAVATSYAAFLLLARFAAERRLRHTLPKLLTAALLGVAIVSVHYSGMAAATFSPAAPARGGVVVDQDAVASVVALATLAVLALLSISALINRQARERRRDEARLRVLADAVPNIVWTAAADGTITYGNRSFADYTGLPAETLASDGWERALDLRDRAATMTAWTTAVGAGTAYRAQTRLLRADGTYRWHVMVAEPLRDERGAVTSWFGTCTDIESQKEAERLANLLSDVTQALSTSLEPADIASKLTRLVVPNEAAYCDVRLYDDAGVLETLASMGEPSRLAPHAARAANAHRAGATLLTRELSTVPVRRAETVLGWLVCCDVTVQAHTLLPELASRLGAALANANAYARERRVASTFQQAALAVEVPDVPGLRFSALYQASQADASVGGDWYDAFRLPDGRVVLSVGDVAGSGLTAAVTMASVRQSIRTAALINPDPVAVLDAVDRIVRAMGQDRFVTAFVGVLDPVCAELAFANAGHPPPLLRHPDGRISELTRCELPLGLRQASDAGSVVIDVPPGALLVAYTDGLTEIERDPLAGHEQLVRAVGECGTDDVAARVYAALSHGRVTRDDVAILSVAFDAALVDVDDPRRASRWTFDVCCAGDAGRVREALIARLRDAGLANGELDAAELVYVELIGNVYRYATGQVDVMLDVSGTAPVLHVLDDGGGFEFRPRLPADPMSERGRGLFLAKAFADEISMERRPSGGSHARAVLLGVTHVRSASAMTRSAL
jgi:PAS domain S-box-containing protein